jgi:hypothetical protein
MTNKKQLFDQAGKQFASGELFNCYLTLLEAGENDFIAKGIEKGYFDYSDFWVGFLSEEDHFTTVFNAKYADELVFYYFNRCKIRSTEFEQQLASKFPLLFVNGVRQTQVFLQPERLSQLLSVKLPDELQVHQKVWERLYQQDTQRWNNVTVLWDQLKTDSLSNHLINTLIWLEHRYFDDDSDQRLQHLSIVYNCFVSLLMEQFESSKIDMTEDEFYQNFHDSVFRRKENPLEVVLSEINDWVAFNESVIVPYSYDLNVHPIWKNDQLSRLENISKETYENWKRDGERYQVNRFNYDWEANEMIDYFEEKGEIDFNVTSEYYRINKDTHVKILKSKLFLDDLKLENFILRGKEVSTVQVLQSILPYSTNRLHRCIRVLEKYRSIFPKWEQAYYKVIEENATKEVDVEPYFLMSRKEYIELNMSAMKETSQEVMEDLIDLFGSQPKWGAFNRHSVRYDVWNRPFLRIGEMLFCPMLFFTKNDWFYGFAQTAIQNLNQKYNFAERKRTAILMEEHLGSLFSEKGWSVKVITDQETSRMKGDIDVFVEDGTTQLLIQLKRTYFRTTLKDAFYESVQSDRKAAQQLNDGVDFLKVDPSIFQLKSEPIKWIVSTSFENILTEIDGCLKVNYFDLIWMLRNEEFGSLNKLVDEINFKN